MSANDDAMDEFEKVQDALGTIMTEIDCPCGEVFLLEGDKNSDVVEYPECKSNLMIRTII